MRSFKNPQVWITGASSGIGGALASAMAAGEAMPIQPGRPWALIVSRATKKRLKLFSK